MPETISMFCHVLGIFLLTCLLICNGVLGQEEMQCQGHDMKYNKTQMSDTLKCLAAANSTSIWKIPTSEFPCFGMCMIKSRGFISEDGKHVVLSRIVTYINTVVQPDSAKPTLIDLVTTCIKTRGDHIDANDPTCMSFLQVGQCVRDSFMEVCV